MAKQLNLTIDKLFAELDSFRLGLSGKWRKGLTCQTVRQMFTHLGLVVTYVGGVISGSKIVRERYREHTAIHFPQLNLNRWKFYFKLVLIN
jgi:dihydroorotate dehydrogenase